MKRIAIAAIVMQAFLILFVDVVGAAAIWDTPKTTIQSHQLVFLRVRDEYQLRYAINGLPSGTHQVRANFWSTTGTYYDTVFDNPTGIAYLTCNGTYIFEVLDAAGNVLSETVQIKTTKIAAPACKSYENGKLKNELNATVKVNEDSSVSVQWPVHDDVYKYDFYENGELYRSVLASDLGTQNGDNHGLLAYTNGSYTIVGTDREGNYVGSIDYVVGGADTSNNPDGGENGSGGDNGGGSSGSCDACKWLTDVLACPAWDDYMGELTNAIKDALPPPTNWDEVASTFVDHFADYFGNVPAVPTKEQIDRNITPPQPTLDTTVPNSDMTPQVPDDFNNGPLDTDITTGEEIEIVDDSEAFEIFEPDAFIDADPTGVMVYPNDPRNHSNGIKEPDSIDTGYPIPTPQPQASSVPEVEAPIPSISPGIIPTPQPQGDYVIPIPKNIEWEG